MKITGQITVDTPQGQMTFAGHELEIEEFNNGPEIEVGWDTGDWSVKKIFGGEPGAGDGDWETDNCTIVSENISVSYTS